MQRRPNGLVQHERHDDREEDSGGGRRQGSCDSNGGLIVAHDPIEPEKAPNARFSCR